MIAVPTLVVFFKEILGALVEGHKPHLEGGVGDFIMQNFFELIEYFISYMSNAMSFLPSPRRIRSGTRWYDDGCVHLG